jgi:hypothetical protein
MMRRTNATDIALPFAVVGAVAYLVLKLTYESLPPFQWFPAVPIAGLAVTEFIIARRVRLAVRHSPSAKPMTALAIARAVALGKASALVGSGVAGAAVGLVLTVLPDASRTSAAGHDLRVGLAVLIAAALVTIAGLFVERAGIDPNADRSR